MADARDTTTGFGHSHDQTVERITNFAGIASSRQVIRSICFCQPFIYLKKNPELIT